MTNIFSYPKSISPDGEGIYGVPPPEYNLDAILKLVANGLGLKTSGFGKAGALYFSS